MKEQELKSKKNMEYEIVILLITLIVILLIKNCCSIKGCYSRCCPDYCCHLNNNTSVTQKCQTIEIAKNSNSKNRNINLDIFKNEKYNGKSIIYPGISGTYYFKVKNTLKDDISYKMDFLEENHAYIPMKYKLKKNGEYIENSKNDYVSYDELNLNYIILETGIQNTYELEWKWEDNSEIDNKYGNANKTITYQLKIIIQAEQMA